MAVKNSKKKNTATFGKLNIAAHASVVYIYIPVHVGQVGWSIIPYLLDWEFRPQLDRGGSMKSCQILSVISAYRQQANRRFSLQ
jgi:hypothetical protein